jgi:hypothetical protein
MVTIFLVTALLIAVMGLGVEIGVASWSIRRAEKYRQKADDEEQAKALAARRRRSMEDRLKSLDEYASRITWLLDFLYNRYDKFSDMETEVEGGLKEVTESTSIGEADDRYKDLKKALKLIQATVKAFERIENLETSEPDKSAEGKADEMPIPEAPEATASVPNGEGQDSLR